MIVQSAVGSKRVQGGRLTNELPSRSASGIKETAFAALYACLISAPILLFGGHKIYSDWREREDARLAAAEAALAYERLVAMPPQTTLQLAEAIHGRELFSTVCVACHGPKGTGVYGLGKDIVESDFVAAQTDSQLVQFLIAGRPDARPVAMPPKGGRDDLNPDDLRDIVTYVRGLQDPRRMPDLPAVVVAPPTETQMAAALASAGGNAELAGYIASGDKLFHSTCVACHGKSGVGVRGNGKALADNAFIKGLDEDGLLAFIKQGRAPSDPKNSTGIQMPPKGGNPALTEDDLLDIIAYLRTLQGTPPAPAAGN